jgi:hypothetical protein
MGKGPLKRSVHSRNVSLFCRQIILPIWRCILCILFIALGIFCLILSAAMEYNGYGFGHDFCISFAIIFFVLSYLVLRKIS